MSVVSDLYAGNEAAVAQEHLHSAGFVGRPATSGCF